ncbi:hypothetical protein [uncultured Corynebacterium sp.]|uniref:hypothetical protein n=1 Tax=uncultured Corynebacterium sp. TaxID=159447 RepID=UPI0025F10B9B|nr:hypothetical protein [uncultured Corynebacterium sp.]
MRPAIIRILGVSMVGILMIILAFTIGAIVGTNNATTASSALLDMLFVGGVSTIFGAIFVGIFTKTSAQVKSVLGSLGLAVAFFASQSWISNKTRRRSFLQHSWHTQL